MPGGSFLRGAVLPASFQTASLGGMLRAVRSATFLLKARDGSHYRSVPTDGGRWYDVLVGGGVEHDGDRYVVERIVIEPGPPGGDLVSVRSVGHWRRTGECLERLGPPDDAE